MLSLVTMIGCIIVCAIAIGLCTLTVIGFIGNSSKSNKSGHDSISECHKALTANQLMHEYEKEVFGWWGGDKEKADAMSANEIQEKWEQHQKKLRDLGLF